MLPAVRSLGKLPDPRKRLELVSVWEGRGGLGPEGRNLSRPLQSWEEEEEDTALG